MKIKPSIMPIVLLGILLFAAIAISISGMTHASTSSTSEASQFKYGTRSLTGASPEQVGQFAQEFVQHQLVVRGGTPQVLLTRSVTRNDVTDLGLGCLPDFAAIEEPPLMLVILKGQFEFSSMPGGSDSPMAEYVAYVFDLWSAMPVALRGSVNGGTFKKALNDPTLPAEISNEPSVCPTARPGKYLHYGQTAPGFPIQTYTVIPTALPSPTEQVPPPVQTVASTPIPPPLPTSGSGTPIVTTAPK